MRGIDEWFTREDESMVAGVGEGARGGARRRAANGVSVGGARSRAWLPSGASQEAREEEAWERWSGRGVEEQERREAARACSRGASCARSRGGTCETRRRPGGPAPDRRAPHVAWGERRGGGSWGSPEGSWEGRRRSSEQLSRAARHAWRLVATLDLTWRST